MARKDISMAPGDLAAFLAEARPIQVATNGPDGFPHVAPMWYVLVDGNVAFRSFTKSQKIVNLRRDPRVTVLAEDGRTYAELRGVMIRGHARLVDDPEFVLDLYARLATRYAYFGPEPLADVTRDAVQGAFGRFAPKNTAVIVEPVKIASWDHRKLGGAY